MRLIMTSIVASLLLSACGAKGLPTTQSLPRTASALRAHSTLTDTAQVAITHAFTFTRNRPTIVGGDTTTSTLLNLVLSAGDTDDSVKFTATQHVVHGQQDSSGVTHSTVETKIAGTWNAAHGVESRPL
jgi:hypothetical protein